MRTNKLARISPAPLSPPKSRYGSAGIDEFDLHRIAGQQLTQRLDIFRRAQNDRGRHGFTDGREKRTASLTCRQHCSPGRPWKRQPPTVPR